MDQEDIVDQVEAPQAKQEYVGDEVDALMTAKQRMAERDAEYAAKYGSQSEDKPAKKSAPKAEQKPSVGKKTPEYAEDAPLERQPAADSKSASDGKPAAVKKDMTAPVVKNIEAKAKSSEGKDVKYGDVKGGLRSLKGGTDAYRDNIQRDRDEYKAAWGKLK